MKRTAAALSMIIACGGGQEAEPVVVEVEPTPSEGVPEVKEVEEPEPEGTIEAAPVDASTGSGVQCPPRPAAKLWSALLRRPKKGFMPIKQTFGCRETAKNQHVDVNITLQPNQCYAFFAESSGSVADVGLRLIVPTGPGLPPMFHNAVLAEESAVSPVAAIGGDQCFKMPLPIPMPITVRATAVAGSGRIALATFSK